MAQEGVKFLYNALPALGHAAGTATVDVEPVSMPFRDEVITLDASPDALRSETQDGSGAEQRQPSGGEPANDEEPGLGGFGDFFALEDPPDASAADATPAKAAAGATLEQGVLKETVAAAEDSQDAAEPGQLPWARASRRIRSPLLRLHNEIAEFCRFLEPTAQETAGRQAATERVSSVITAIWPRANVQVFGSFATGLYLPTSDMDLVVTDSGCADVRQGLRALAQALACKGMAKNVQVVAKAKVPIIKFEETASGFNFDISFDVANGPVTAAYVRELMAKLPPMRPLLFILKIFLQQREMNEVYSGGIGSYALLVMVAAFLQSHVSRTPLSAHSHAAAGLDPCLGVLLLDFFRLYGRSLFADYVGVSCRKGATFFDKRSRGHYQYERPFMLSVEDPNDPENDLAKGSYNAPRIRQAFEYAYMQLARGGPPEESLLARVIRLDTVLTDRPRPPPPPDYVDAPLQAGGDSLEEGAISLSEDDENLPDLVETRRQRRRREQAEKKAASRQKKERKKRKRVRERDAAFGDVSVEADSEEEDFTPPPSKLRHRDEPRHHSHGAHAGARSQSAGERAPYNVGGSSRDAQQGGHSRRGEGSQHSSHHQHGGSRGGDGSRHGHTRSHHSSGKRKHIRFD